MSRLSLDEESQAELLKHSGRSNGTWVTGPVPQYGSFISSRIFPCYGKNFYGIGFFNILLQYFNMYFHTMEEVLGDFRVTFRLCVKVSPIAKSFIWKLILFTCKSVNQNLHVNKTNFHMKGYRTRTRFETEAKCNSAVESPICPVIQFWTDSVSLHQQL